MMVSRYIYLRESSSRPMKHVRLYWIYNNMWIGCWDAACMHRRSKTLGAHGQGTVRHPKTNSIILVGGPLDLRGPMTLSTRLLRPWFFTSCRMLR